MSQEHPGVAYAEQILLSERRYGKTRAAARAVAVAAKVPHTKIALLGASYRQARQMALAVVAESSSARFGPASGLINWDNGSVAYVCGHTDNLKGRRPTLIWFHQADPDALQTWAEYSTVRTEADDQLEFWQ